MKSSDLKKFIALSQIIKLRDFTKQTPAFILGQLVKWAGMIFRCLQLVESICRRIILLCMEASGNSPARERKFDGQDVDSYNSDSDDSNIKERISEEQESKTAPTRH